MPGFLATGSGSAANPSFSGSLVATLPQFVATGEGLYTPAEGGPTIATYQRFDAGELPDDWEFFADAGGSTTISTNAALNLNGSAGSFKGSFPAAEGVHVYGGYYLPEPTSDIYLDFWAKIPGAKKGCKFIKIFGRNPNDHGEGASNYANTTFAVERSNADITQVSFGDGSGTQNDTAQVINLDGTNKSFAGRSYPGTALISTPQNRKWSGASDWGTSWHHFRMRAKFNDGTTALNEVANGAYYLEIDGVVYVNATGLFNRHYTNQPIERIVICDYADSNVAFEVWYDDFRITTGGFAS
jgi:hypothetical protein